MISLLVGLQARRGEVMLDGMAVVPKSSRRREE